MYKYIIFLWFIFLVTATKAQEFNAGMYGGLVASQIDGDTYGGYNKAGFLLGGYVNREIQNNLLWQLGLRYIQKGSRRAGNESGIDYRAQLHYMEIPFTLKYFHYKKLAFEGGLALGYLIKAFEEFDKAGTIDANPEFNSFDASVMGGLCYTFNDKISVSGTAQYSMLQVRPFESSSNVVMVKGQHNNLVYFTLSYNISSFR